MKFKTNIPMGQAFYGLAALRKLEESAKLFDFTVENLAKDPFVAEIFFNAFLSSIWSTTKYLQRELSHFDKNKITDNALNWYKDNIAELSDDQLCKYFYELRTQSIHNFVIEQKHLVKADSKSAIVIGFFVDCNQKELAKYKEFQGKNILELSINYFDKVKKFIVKADKQFGFKNIPPEPFFGAPGYFKPNVATEILKKAIEAQRLKSMLELKD